MKYSNILYGWKYLNDHEVLKKNFKNKYCTSLNWSYLKNGSFTDKILVWGAKKFVIQFSDRAENENILIFKNVNMTFTKKMLISSTKKALAVLF